MAQPRLTLAARALLFAQPGLWAGAGYAARSYLEDAETVTIATREAVASGLCVDTESLNGSRGSSMLYFPLSEATAHLLLSSGVFGSDAAARIEVVDLESATEDHCEDAVRGAKGDGREGRGELGGGQSVLEHEQEDAMSQYASGCSGGAAGAVEGPTGDSDAAPDLSPAKRVRPPAHGSFVVLSGPAGSGKSLLVHRLLKALKGVPVFRWSMHHEAAVASSNADKSATERQLHAWVQKSLQQAQPLLYKVGEFMWGAPRIATFSVLEQVESALAHARCGENGYATPVVVIDCGAQPLSHVLKQHLLVGDDVSIELSAWLRQQMSSGVHVLAIARDTSILHDIPGFDEDAVTIVRAGNWRKEFVEHVAASFPDLDRLYDATGGRAADVCRVLDLQQRSTVTAEDACAQFAADVDTVVDSMLGIRADQSMPAGMRLFGENTDDWDIGQTVLVLSGLDESSPAATMHAAARAAGSLELPLPMFVKQVPEELEEYIGLLLRLGWLEFVPSSLGRRHDPEGAKPWAHIFPIGDLRMVSLRPCVGASLHSLKDRDAVKARWLELKAQCASLQLDEERLAADTATLNDDTARAKILEAEVREQLEGHDAATVNLALIEVDRVKHEQYIRGREIESRGKSIRQAKLAAEIELRQLETPDLAETIE